MNYSYSGISEALARCQTLPNFPTRSFQTGHHCNKQSLGKVGVNLLQVKKSSAHLNHYAWFWLDGVASLDTVHTFCPAQTQLIHKNSARSWKVLKGVRLHMEHLYIGFLKASCPSQRSHSKKSPSWLHCAVLQEDNYLLTVSTRRGTKQVTRHQPYQVQHTPF